MTEYYIYFDTQNILPASLENFYHTVFAHEVFEILLEQSRKQLIGEEYTFRKGGGKNE